MALRRTGIRAAGARPARRARPDRMRRRRRRGVGARPARPRQDDAGRGEQRRTSSSTARAHRRPAPCSSGGEGDIARPASFEGTLKVLAAGVDARPRGRLRRRHRLRPAALHAPASASSTRPQFGFGDPGALLDPETGISQLLDVGRVRRAGGGAPGGRRGRPRGDRRPPRRARRADPHQRGPEPARAGAVLDRHRERRAAPGRADRTVLRRRATTRRTRSS